MSQVEFTVIVPVYKSVDTLAPLFAGIRDVMDDMKRTFEVVFVEDSGADESWKELLRLKAEFPEAITIIRLSRNFGQNGATLCGIDQANGRKIITIDDDLQTPPEEIRKLILFQEESDADVVYGKYPESKTSWIRKVGGNMMKRLFRKNDGGSIGSSFRLIDNHIVQRLRFHAQDHLFINQVISWYTLNAQFVEIEHAPRTDGKSGYSLFKLIGLSIRLILYYTSIPLKIIIALCLIAAFGIIGMTIYYIHYQLDAGNSIDLFMITVLVSMALISGSISVFGVYINRIYAARVKKPNYAIKVKM
ncbi:MAG: undecaprenyl-phosphate 4-deoxy-4-formamido-L-arabinose transferase [Crocinitomicaceae bacterium]